MVWIKCFKNSSNKPIIHKLERRTLFALERRALFAIAEIKSLLSEIRFMNKYMPKIDFY